MSRQTIALDYRNFNTSADSFKTQRNIEFIVMPCAFMKVILFRGFINSFQLIDFCETFCAEFLCEFYEWFVRGKTRKNEKHYYIFHHEKIECYCFWTNQSTSIECIKAPRHKKNHSALKCWWQCECQCQLQAKSYTLANTIITFIY